MTILKRRTIRLIGPVCLLLAMIACSCKSEKQADENKAKAEAKKDKPTDNAAPAPAKPQGLLGDPGATAAPAQPKPKPPKAEPPTPGTFLTYNLGLLTAVGLREQRLPEIIAAMKETRASVVCLQEVWHDSDYQTLASELAGVYPHSYRKKTEELSTYAEAPCDLKQAVAVQGCASKKCTPQGTSLFECMAAEDLCKPDYDGLSIDCKHCLGANTDNPTTCALGTDKAAKVSFWGGNGLALLSYSEIENPTFTAMDSQLVTRGVITATIDGRTVQCTHLSTEVSIIPRKPGGKHASWQDEHMAQLRDIDKLGASRGGQSGDSASCRVFMGDMNTGPAVGDLMGEFPENYPFFKDNGWILTWDEPPCTFCPDNPLTGAPRGSWIDHVFFKGCKADAKFAYRRVFDGEITVENEGKQVATRLSDHYGVLVEATGL